MSTRMFVGLMVVGLLLAPVVTWAVLPIFAPIVLTAVRVGVGSYAVPTTTAAGVSAGWSALATGVATTLGGAVTYFAMKDAQNREVRIPVDTTSGAQPIPAPSAPSTAEPISTGYSMSNPCGGSSVSGATPEAVCQAFATTWNTCPPGGASAVSYNTVFEGGCYVTLTVEGGTSGNGPSTISAGGTGCPAGYTLSGSVCTLSNPRQVTPDARVDVKRVGNTYEHEPDVDNQFVPVINSGNAVNVSGTDQFGNPTSLKVEATATGTRITQQVQTRDSASNSTVTSKELNLNLSGQPVSTSQHTQPGTLVQNQTTQQTTITQAPAGAQASSEQPCQPGGGGERNCEATQQEIKQALTAKPAEDKPADSTLTPKTTTQIQGVMPNIGLSGWTIPAHSSTCPVMTFDTEMFGGTTVNVDQHCTIMDGQAANVAVWFDLMWLLVALLVLLTA